MPYATPSQMESYLGSERYLSIADRGRNGAPDLAAVTGAISKASSIADSYLSHLLAIPSPYPEVLVDHVLAIATYRLAGNDATETERTNFEDARAWLLDVAKGRAHLAAPEAKVDTDGPEIMVEAATGDWSKDEAGGAF